MFSDFDYVEVKLETAKHPQSITLNDDPYVLIRPEGRGIRPAFSRIRRAGASALSSGGSAMSSVIDLDPMSAPRTVRLLVMVDLQTE